MVPSDAIANGYSTRADDAPEVVVEPDRRVAGSASQRVPASSQQPLTDAIEPKNTGVVPNPPDTERNACCSRRWRDKERRRNGGRFSALTAEFDLLRDVPHPVRHRRLEAQAGAWRAHNPR